MRILITGGNGFIGSHLVDQLASFKHHHVVVIDLCPRAYESLPEDVIFIHGNFGDIDLVYRVLLKHKIDVVYHLAWATIHETALKDPISDIKLNLIPAVSLLQACVDNEVKRVIFLSSGGQVYGISDKFPIKESCPTNPINAYGITKLATEKYIQMYCYLHKLEYVIFRPSVPYGPRQDPRLRQGAVSVFTYKALLEQSIHIWGDGEILRDFYFVKDMTRALVTAVDSQQVTDTIINLGGKKTYTLNQLVSLIEEVLGLKTKVMHEVKRFFDVPNVQLDINLASEKLGWRPTTSMRDGILQTAEWIRNWIINR